MISAVVQQSSPVTAPGGPTELPLGLAGSRLDSGHPQVLLISAPLFLLLRALPAPVPRPRLDGTQE